MNTGLAVSSLWAERRGHTACARLGGRGGLDKDGQVGSKRNPPPRCHGYRRIPASLRCHGDLATRLCANLDSGCLTSRVFSCLLLLLPFLNLVAVMICINESTGKRIDD